MVLRSIVHRVALCGLLVTSCEAQVLDGSGHPNTSYPGLYAWFDAGDGVNGAGTPADGAVVTRWNDRSGNGRDLVRTSGTADERPVYKAGIANGFDVVRFDGNDYIWGDRTGEFGTINGAKTIFFVSYVRAANGGYVFDSTSASSGRNAAFTGQTSNPAQWVLYSGNDPVTGGPLVDHDVVQVHSVVFDANANGQFINGVSISSGTSALAPLAGLVVGARYSLSNRFDGDIAELLVYDEVLSDANRQAVEGYLIGKHPITDPPNDGPQIVDVFSRGEFYDAFRIPSVITTMNGSVLAFAEARASLNDHSRNDMVMKRSIDGGQSWGFLEVLHNDGNNSLNDPLVVQVQEGPNAGRIILMYMSFPEGCHTNCVQAGYTGSNICRNYMMYSDSDGLFWSTPQDVTTIVRRETARFAGSPGFGVQKSHGPAIGRLVMPLREVSTGGSKIYALYSDDGGDTWTRGNLVDDSNTPGGGDEVQMVELADGTLRLNSRSYSGIKRRKTALSFDGGVNWTQLEDEPELIEPQCMGSILAATDPIDGFSSSRILYAGPNSTSSRSQGTVHMSYDGGDTWPVSRLVYPGAYAYSCLTKVDCDTYGVFFEKDGYQHMSFARFSLDWLSSGADPDECGCVADWNSDGALNTSDFIAYLNDYNTVLGGGVPVNGDPDLAPPIGSINTSDFIAYLNLYASGCSS